MSKLKAQRSCLQGVLDWEVIVLCVHGYAAVTSSSPEDAQEQGVEADQAAILNNLIEQE